MLRHGITDVADAASVGGVLYFSMTGVEVTPLADAGSIRHVSMWLMRILITAGPTREYLDEVRFLSNASSGRMGYAIAESAIAAGHAVCLVTGPVLIPTPPGCDVHQVETSQQMLDTCCDLLTQCDGVIGAAAVCDYRPQTRVSGKISKTGVPIVLELVETADVLAELGRRKGHRWIVGFALEADDPHAKALRKLRKKQCNAILLNRPAAINALDNSVELIDGSGEVVARWSGLKRAVADELIRWIENAFQIGKTAVNPA